MFHHVSSLFHLVSSFLCHVSPCFITISSSFIIVMPCLTCFITISSGFIIVMPCSPLFRLVSSLFYLVSSFLCHVHQHSPLAYDLWHCHGEVFNPSFQVLCLMLVLMLILK